MRRIKLTLLALAALVAFPATVALAQAVPGEETAPITLAGPRVEAGLAALYRFDNVIDGRVIPELTGMHENLDLTISSGDIGTVYVGDGALHLDRKMHLPVPGAFSAGPANSLTSMIKAAGQFSVEAWLQAGNLEQAGPARIVSLSRSTLARNLTLGQTRSQFTVRVRTSATGPSGTPELNTTENTVRTDRVQHVVVTFDGVDTCVYLDGELILISEQFAGSLEDWEEGMWLVLGNEYDGQRRWHGQLHLVALYSLPLTAEQVLQNFQTGL